MEENSNRDWRRTLRSWSHGHPLEFALLGFVAIGVAIGLILPACQR